MTETPIKVLVCDDHPIVREGIVAILETQPDIDVIGDLAPVRDRCRALVRHVARDRLRVVRVQRRGDVDDFLFAGCERQVPEH